MLDRIEALPMALLTVRLPWRDHHRDARGGPRVGRRAPRRRPHSTPTKPARNSSAAGCTGRRTVRIGGASGSRGDSSVGAPHLLRHGKPGFDALNFVCEQALGGGGMASPRCDPLGKSMAQTLLTMPLQVAKERL